MGGIQTGVILDEVAFFHGVETRRIPGGPGPSTAYSWTNFSFNQTRSSRSLARKLSILRSQPLS